MNNLVDNVLMLFLILVCYIFSLHISRDTILGNLYSDNSTLVNIFKLIHE